jgi:hypothetical protein
VDRIGQARVPHVVHLVARGTAETAVRARLVRRVRRAASAIGHVRNPLGDREDEVAARLLRVVSPTSSPAASPSGGVAGRVAVTEAADLPALASAEANRLQEARGVLRSLARRWKESEPEAVGNRLLGEIAWLDAHRPLAVSLRYLRETLLPQGLLAVFRVRIADTSGRIVEDGLLPLRLPVSSGQVQRILAREAPGDLMAFCAPLTDQARAAGLERKGRVASAVRHAMDRFVERERTLDRHRLERAASQPGLFDLRRPPEGAPQRDSDPETGETACLTAETELMLVAAIR